MNIKKQRIQLSKENFKEGKIKKLNRLAATALNPIFIKASN